MKYPISTKEQLDKWLNASGHVKVAPVIPWPVLLGWETMESLQKNIKQYEKAK